VSSDSSRSAQIRLAIGLTARRSTSISRSRIDCSVSASGWTMWAHHGQRVAPGVRQRLVQRLVRGADQVHDGARRLVDQRPLHLQPAPVRERAEHERHRDDAGDRAADDDDRRADDQPHQQADRDGSPRAARATT